MFKSNRSYPKMHQIQEFQLALPFPFFFFFIAILFVPPSLSNPFPSHIPVELINLFMLLLLLLQLLLQRYEQSAQLLTSEVFFYHLRDLAR